MVGLRIDPELKERLQGFAKEENRTLSNFIINALLVYLKEHKKFDWHAEKDSANKASRTN